MTPPAFSRSFANWRDAAIALMPAFAELIDRAPSIGELWFALTTEFEAAHGDQRRPPDEDRIRQIFDFIAWCFDHESQTNSDVGVAFLEPMTWSDRIRNALPRWLDRPGFDGFARLLPILAIDSPELQAAIDARRKKTPK